MSPIKITDELVHHPHMARIPQRWATGPVMGAIPAGAAR